MSQTGADFLNKLYQDLHMNDVVMHTAEKSDMPAQKIAKYLERLEAIHDLAQESPHKKELLRYLYYDKYVIKELPKNYIAMIEKKNAEEGKSNTNIDEAKLLQKVQKDQMASLDQWLDYLTSPETDYPMWFKYFAFNGMLKLNNFNKENESFGKRTKTTTDFYIELNREALAQVYETILAELEDKPLTTAQERALEHGESFSKLYIHYLQKQGVFNPDNEIEGKWIKYDWGSDYLPLWESLQGKYTGWCTAGKATAKDQLKHGDFYIYYTKDKNGDYTNPRIAIRMSGSTEIEEVRGVASHQNLESNMLEITEQKLATFHDYQKFKQRLQDMKDLTKLEQKMKANEPLSKEDISLLYEIDHTVNGFGYNRDPRLEELRATRDVKQDLMEYYDCTEENIGTQISDFVHKDVVIYFGDLSARKVAIPEHLQSLKMVKGLLDFGGETSASNLCNLECIDGSAWFKNLTSSEGLEHLHNINGSAYFNNLEDLSGLRNIKSVGGFALLTKYSDEYLDVTDFLKLVKGNNQSQQTDIKAVGKGK